jgi:16S rRNA (guanine527-N7)-methyltransferase
VKHLEDVAPAHAIDALALILGLQATDPTASTTVRDPAEAVGRHVADSLTALDLPYVADARRIVDLGSGAGWPGLALAAALPDAHVWLVDSAIRHCRYLERAVELSGLNNATVIHSRIEEWHGQHDVVTARALAALPVLVEYAAPLLEPGGHFVAWKGAASPEETSAGAVAAGIVGLEPVEVIPVLPYEGARDHSLHVFRKTGDTPERFPRRAGMATKRPLA